MVAIFVVLFIIIVLSLDGIINREKHQEFNKISKKDRLVDQSAPPEFGTTMADDGEFISKK